MTSWSAALATFILLMSSGGTRPLRTELLLLPLTDDMPVRSTAKQPGVSRSPVAMDARVTDENVSESVNEMLVAANGRRQHWTGVPELVVLTSVMEYQPGRRTDYVATAISLSPDEVTELAADLTAALAVLTDNQYTTFATVTYERVSAGAEARIARPGQIVVGRYKGVRGMVNEIGMGGRTSRADGTITSGAILLDSDYDREDSRRRLLRTHELGHALGYNHVQSRVSIMNPKIGSDITPTDRAAASLAFHASAQ
jgi:hypothetical protein